MLNFVGINGDGIAIKVLTHSLSYCPSPAFSKHMLKTCIYCAGDASNFYNLCDTGCPVNKITLGNFTIHPTVLSDILKGLR